MVEKNDWRLTCQDKYLMNRELKKAYYKAPSERWNHDHCEFCWDRFSNYDGSLHEGYCTLNEQIWICENCYNDFRDMFHWVLKED